MSRYFTDSFGLQGDGKPNGPHANPFLSHLASELTWVSSNPQSFPNKRNLSHSLLFEARTWHNGVTSGSSISHHQGEPLSPVPNEPPLELGSRSAVDTPSGEMLKRESLVFHMPDQLNAILGDHLRFFEEGRCRGRRQSEKNGIVNKRRERRGKRHREELRGIKGRPRSQEKLSS